MHSGLLEPVSVREPQWLVFLRSVIFSRPLLAPVWLAVRVYVGWQWLQSGLTKLSGHGWVDQDGRALHMFWASMSAVTDKGPAIKFPWYRSFITFMLHHHWYTWFSWLIAISEFAVGLLLITGAFCGIAALAGATMNLNYMLAGSLSINPVLFPLEILIILGWKVAGFIGADRWLLPTVTHSTSMRSQVYERRTGVMT